jgi:hypothetical protein
MANLVCGATGNFTAAGTWFLSVDGLLSTSISTTALSVANQDSASFIPAAVALNGIVLRVASRASGAPTNTITVILRNTTAGTDAATVTANVSDLPACSAGTNSEGGWHYFKFSASHTPNGTDNYVVRCLLSSTSTAVSLATNGTAANWQRLVVRTTTQAPAAGDDLFMAQTLDGSTNPATVTSRTVTMDSTAATDYGSAVVSQYQPAISVSKACTFTYGTTAATNYVLRISGLLVIYSAAIFRIGNTGAEIPRDSTAVLEFDNASDGQFGIRCLNGSTVTMHGLSRTSGKDQWMALLTADEAAASTTIDIDTDTGWLNNDEVLITSTSRTSGQNEVRSLNANAGASSFTISAGLTNAHLGTGDYIGEVFLLTRNVEVRSVSTTNMMFAHFINGTSASLKWMRWRYYSSISGGGLFSIETSAVGSFSIQFSVWRDSDQGVSVASGAGNWTVDKCLLYNNSSVGTSFVVSANQVAAWTLTDFAVCEGPTAISFASLINGTIGNLWLVGNSGGLIWNTNAKLNDGTGAPTFPANTVWKMHSNDGGAGSTCFDISGTITDITFPIFNFWRNNTGAPIQLNLSEFMSGVVFTGNFFANGVSGTEEPCCFIAARDNGMGDITFLDCNISGDTTFQPNWGCLFDGFNIFAPEIRWINCKFSENTGTRRPLLVADIGVIPDLDSGSMLVQGIADSCTFGAPESIKWYLGTGPNPRLANKYSYVMCPRYNQNNAQHRMYTPFATHIIDTTTFDVTPSQNMKPITTGFTTLPIDSNGFRRNTGFLVAVNSGDTVTVSVKVQIDASYNGSTAPQLVMLANRALGFNADVVLDTHAGGTGSFETLSGTTGAAGADGVLEFVVRIYGNAGNAWIDTWATAAPGKDATGDRYWWGQPVTNANTSGGGGGSTPSSHSYA